MGCVVLDDFLYVLGGTNRHNEVLQVTVQCDVSGAYPDCGLRIFKIIGSATLLISNDVDPDPSDPHSFGSVDPDSDPEV